MSSINSHFKKWFFALALPIINGCGWKDLLMDFGSERVEPPSISISDVSVIETNARAVQAVFTIVLSTGVPNSVTVSFYTENGSADSGSDYISNSGLLTFLPGQTNQEISVRVLDDTELEPEEAFHVNLTNPQNATLLDGRGRGSILDDDLPPLLQSDSFIASGQRANFLFVMDDTQSMQDENRAIVDKTVEFIRRLEQRRKVDYWVAVTVADTRWLIERIEKNKGGMLLDSGGIEVIKSTSTPNPVEKVMTLLDVIFKINTNHSQERPWDSTRFALLREGEKFERPAVPTTVILISDEEDKSCGLWAVGDGCPEKGASVAFFSEFFRNRPTIPILYPIVVLPTSSCTSGKEIGFRQIQVQSAVGTGASLDLCNVEASYLRIADELSQSGECYTLKHRASGNYFVVEVNGRTIDLRSGEFNWDPKINAVCFSGDYTPPIGSRISVEYAVKN